MSKIPLDVCEKDIKLDIAFAKNLDEQSQIIELKNGDKNVEYWLGH